MKGALSWLAAISLLGCVVLGYLAAHQKIKVIAAEKLVANTQKELAEAKTEMAQADSRREKAEKEAQKQILELQQQLASVKSVEASAEKQAAAESSGRASAAASDGNANPNGTTVVHLSDIIKDHPEYAALYAKQMRRNVDRMYGGTLDTLNLPPQQLSQLKDLLAERQMSFMDAMRLSSAAGLKQGTPEWQDVDQQINAILGDNSSATLSQLQARAGIQNQITYTYGPDFADAGAPLSAEQSRNLLQVMSDANYAGKDASARPKGYNDVNPATGLTPHDSRILDVATGILSPAQIQILKTDQIENHQISAIMKQYNKGGGPVAFVP